MKLAIHWSGPLLVLGSLGVGASIAMMSARPEVNQALAPALAGLLLGSTTLLLLGLPAMYAVQADRAGGLGLAGHVLLATGLLLLVVLAGLPVADVTLPNAERALRSDRAIPASNPAIRCLERSAGRGW